MLKKVFNISHISAGFTAVLVGYTSSVVIIIQAATAAGATAAQIESGLWALGVAMGLSSLLFSWFYKRPVLTAWSTPGAAMLVAAVGQYSMPEVIGAFIVSGILIVLTGMITPLARLLERIPPYLGTAMLGAILLPFCLKAFQPLGSTPVVFLLMFGSYLVAKYFVPRYTMLILLVVGVACAVFGGSFNHAGVALNLAQPEWVSPRFDVMAMLNLSLPLYVLTMLSQNLPGVAMMRSHGYDAPVKPLLIGTGLTNVVFAPFGGFQCEFGGNFGSHLHERWRGCRPQATLPCGNVGGCVLFDCGRVGHHGGGFVFGFAQKHHPNLGRLGLIGHFVDVFANLVQRRQTTGIGLAHIFDYPLRCIVFGHQRHIVGLARGHGVFESHQQISAQPSGL